ncbi:MAG: GNAT family N-acetyltransferase [Nocardioides sp.]
MGDLTLRPITPADHAYVLDLNERHVDLLSPVDDARLGYLLDHAHRSDVLEVDGERAGFVFTFAPDAGYDGLNFAWFGERFGEEFYYLDRVVVDEAFRRRGLGAAAYDELERTAAPYRRMVLEVNSEPPNEPSLAFHRTRGYVDVGTRGDPGHRVAMLSLELA